ncbi:hypothetical protein CEXT_381761 [Caerostris extrusa]|uniref:Uncharacterized protein n=1 Tax=Caerostris extrusa TaxID=172846 RepID=A0AAV4WE01_CAEEX|nr:hypothetical protein CEXT_381761 [Caerostris extrusa]
MRADTTVWRRSKLSDKINDDSISSSQFGTVMIEIEMTTTYVQRSLLLGEAGGALLSGMIGSPALSVMRLLLCPADDFFHSLNIREPNADVLEKESGDEFWRSLKQKQRSSSDVGEELGIKRRHRFMEGPPIEKFVGINLKSK